MRPRLEAPLVSSVMLLAGLLTGLLTALEAQAPASAPPQAAEECARSWVGRTAEIEEYLKTAPIVRVEDVPIGITKPKRAYFRPGGPVESAAWKPLPRGRRGGFLESYQAEIAAYEVDKLLGLDLVPPTVEREYEGRVGALILWAIPTRMWRMDREDPPQTLEWNRQVRWMKMFDALIGNIDRNAGNLLIDPEWHVVLIDHSRAFTEQTRLPSSLSRVDRDLWERMLGLTEEQLSAALRPHLDTGAIRAILKRRQKMQEEIERLVAERGEAAVYVR